MLFVIHALLQLPSISHKVCISLHKSTTGFCFYVNSLKFMILENARKMLSKIYLENQVFLVIHRDIFSFTSIDRILKLFEYISYMI